MFNLAPSILSADFTRIHEAIEIINNSSAEYIHCDVMDGSFVPNITFGPKMIADIKKIAKKPLDVHLMMDNPERYIYDFVRAGADIITVHAEATKHLHRLIYMIKETGVKAGVAINPATSINAIQPIVGDIDMLLVMTVNPGFGGQKFIPECLSKISTAAGLFAMRGVDALIEVDGGINDETIVDVARAGANIIVTGSAVFSSEDPAAAIEKLHAAF